VNVKLFLPKAWCEDKKRGEKVGIPPAEQVYRSKWELALVLIDELEGQVSYDWINGDGFYGNAQGFRAGLAHRNKLFVLDIHPDQGVYWQHPLPYVPVSVGKGRNPSVLISDQQPTKVSDWLSRLQQEDWKTYTFRAGTKGAMTRQVYTTPVYLWNAKSADDKLVEQYTLLISRKTDGSEVKYALANDVENAPHPTLSDSALLYRQMNRYWVARGIQDCKDTLGMTDYQVRSWRAFYHHITLTIMALHYMLIQKVSHQHTIPLLSCPDIKFALARTLPSNITSQEQVWMTIRQRHKQRQDDIDRCKTLKC
jgi:SRSO17 transposase